MRAYEFLIKETVSCRSDEGITVGIVDSIITSLRLLKTRDLDPQLVQESLLDIGDDPDFDFLLDAIKNAKGTEKTK